MKSKSAVIAFLALVVHVSSARADSPPAPCKPLTAVASLDLTDLNDGRVSVPVTIEGKSIPMLLSTARTETTIDDSAAHTLGLVQQRIVHMMGMPYAYVATVNGLEIGGVQYKKDFLLVDPSPKSADAGTQGVLGKDHIKPFDIELDAANRQFKLFLWNHCPDQIHWPAVHIVTLPLKSDREVTDSFSVTLDGKTFDAVVATGRPSTFLTDYAAKMTFGLSPESSGMTEIPAEQAGSSSTYRYVFKTLDVGGLVLSNVPVTIFHISGPAYAYPLQLGMHELRSLHVYLAFQEGKMYASLAEQPKSLSH